MDLMSKQAKGLMRENKRFRERYGSDKENTMFMKGADMSSLGFLLKKSQQKIGRAKRDSMTRSLSSPRLLQSTLSSSALKVASQYLPQEEPKESALEMKDL